MRTTDKEFDALLSLLQDEDAKVASLAMEQFLKLGDVSHALARFQEHGNSRIRHRIHQIGSIILRRKAKRQFTQAVDEDTPSLWQGVCEINQLYDPQSNIDKLNRQVRELASELPGIQVKAADVAALMKEKEFLVPDEDVLDGELYMMDSVMDTRYGSAVALAVLAGRLGELRDWEAAPVLFEGRLCLIEKEGVLLDPAGKWKVSLLKESDKLHTCAKADVWFMFLSQLFLVALVEGQLRDLYHFGDLLTALNGHNVDDLPYPLGAEEDDEPFGGDLPPR